MFTVNVQYPNMPWVNSFTVVEFNKRIYLFKGEFRKIKIFKKLNTFRQSYVNTLITAF